MNTIKYDDFAKLDLRTAVVVEAKPHPNADKLLVLKVRLGVDDERQIVAGIRKHYAVEDLVGKNIIVVANLEPVILRGEPSHGMLLAASDANSNLSLLTLDRGLTSGCKVG